MPRQKRALTPQGVERLRPPAKGQAEHRDAIVPGLILRVSKHGTKSFCVRYTVAGKGGVTKTGRKLAGDDCRITLGQTPPLELKAAREQARMIIEQASEGIDPRPERSAKNLHRFHNTFDKLSVDFIERE